MEVPSGEMRGSRSSPWPPVICLRPEPLGCMVSDMKGATGVGLNGNEIALGRPIGM